MKLISTLGKMNFIRIKINLVYNNIKIIRQFFMFILVAVLMIMNVLDSIAQNHRYDRYDGPTDGKLGLECLIIGGIIWGIGMLLGQGLRKENGVIAEGQTFLYRIVGLLCVGGGLIAAFGLIMLGF